jgi:hypothetical protein
VIDHGDVDPQALHQSDGARELMPFSTVSSRSFCRTKSDELSRSPNRGPHPGEAEMFWLALLDHSVRRVASPDSCGSSIRRNRKRIWKIVPGWHLQEGVDASMPRSVRTQGKADFETALPPTRSLIFESSIGAARWVMLSRGQKIQSNRRSPIH